MNGPTLKTISRHDAHKAGSTRYFTGRTCIRGHLAERFVSSGGCVQCVNFKRHPAATAPNAVMPPSPYVFPGWVRVTPELLSEVHGAVLLLLPDLVNEVERKLGKFLPLAGPYYMTDKAEGRTREDFIRAGWTDRDMQAAGYVAMSSNLFGQ